ncbi:MAG TPA: (d)CMP kinase [Blastocatellia bacterium]|nr:(d)CMP kinase [Blastocatellia bacterium]
MAGKKLIVAIDGPAGAGKSTVAKALARRLGYLYIDSGAMYRAVAWKALAAGVALDDAARVGALAETSQVELLGGADELRVLIDGRDVTDEVRAPQVSAAASRVSAVPAVRRALVARQQEMGRAGGVVMEGRDIGTQVFPWADVKFFLDASVEARSGRRFLQDIAGGQDAAGEQDAAGGAAGPSLAATRAEIEERDLRDRTRATSPLVRADDAVYIDSSGLTVEQVIERMRELVETKVKE